VFEFLRTEVGLQPDWAVLDVGAGPLRIGTVLIDFLRAEHYFAIEPDQKILQRGLNVLPPRWLEEKGPTFRHDDKFDLSAFSRKFDLVLAFNVFIHCDVSQLRDFLLAVPPVLEENGRLVCSIALDKKNVVLPNRQDRGNRYKHAACNLVTYTREDIEKEIQDAGLQLEKAVHWGKGTDWERKHSHQLVLRKQS
jgi:SAM-dependent methyltransferase